MVGRMENDRSAERGRATIRQVADRAGVSHQTVSRYLRFGSGLKPATVEKVEAAINELDYRPDLIARSMRTRRTNRIAVVLPELLHFVPIPLQGATAAAHEAGYRVDVVSLEGDAGRRRDRVLTLLDSERIEGILSLGSLGEELSEGGGHGIPIMVMGEYDDKMHSTGVFADGGVMNEIVQHLAGFGHQRLLHIAGPSDAPSARNRRRIYLESVEQLGLESYGVFAGDWSIRAGYEAARDLPANSGVTAIVAANDFVALGTVRALQDRGISVPGDVSVTGWNDEEFARYLAPTLSTVRQNMALMGRRAMEALVARIEGRDDPTFPEEPMEWFIPRGSSGPAPR